MADRYVIAAGGNWNSTATWSDSSGGAGGFSIPVATDNVFLDANSGNLVQNDGTATCANFVCTGYTGTLSGSSALAHTGATFLLVAGMTYTYSGAITFTGANAGGATTITRATQTATQNYVFNGVSKTFNFADAQNIGTGNITVTNGTLNSQGFDITCTGFNSNNTNTRTITLTGSDVFLNQFGIVDGTNLTFAAPDLIRITRTSTTTPSNTVISAGVALKKVEINMAVSPSITGGTITETGGNLSIEYLEFIGVPGSGFLSFVWTVDTNVTLDRCDFPMGVALVSSSRGTQRTITTNTNEISFDGCMIRDIVISGGPAIATNSIDLGNNSGITFQNFGANTHEITGVTYDDNGDPLESTVYAFKVVGGDPILVGSTTSDAMTGAYTIGTPDDDAAAYMIVATNDDTDERADAMGGITPTAP